MTSNAIKPSPDREAMDGMEAADLHPQEIDAVVARNRDVLNESLLRSYEEIARGQISRRTIDDIVAEGKQRFRARRPS